MRIVEGVKEDVPVGGEEGVVVNGVEEKVGNGLEVNGVGATMDKEPVHTMTGVQSTLEVLPEEEKGKMMAEIPYEFDKPMKEEGELLVVV
ncbi:MAG: hypothetical protein Q9222_006286 [Ikaeria aurantiellina]